jgi:LysR family hydrogen peroxide-inducible transcriptional activator
MINFTLRQLRYFEALKKHGHFGRAADAAAITQPALSMQIKELEEILGTPLFERGGRQIRLTSFGEEFARRARDILHSVEELGDLARESQNRGLARLRLGVIPTIAPYLLPAVIREVTQEFPGIELFLRETQTRILLQELAESRLDAAILALPISEPSLIETPLFDESFVLVRPECDRDLPVPNHDRLREMRLLLLEEGHCFRDQALSFCNIPSAHPREMMDGSALSTLVQMVGAGIGVTLIPEMAVAVETRSAPVAVARFENPQPSRTVGMIWRKTSPLQDQLSEVAGIVRRAAQGTPLTPKEVAAQ